MNEMTPTAASQSLRTPRRTVLTASAWSAGAVALAASAPAAAASTVPVGPTDLSVELLDPTMDSDTWAYVTDQPVYAFGSTSTERFRASAPSAMVITNLGPNAAENPAGTLDTRMMNYDYDAASSALNYTLVDSPMPEAQFSPTGTAARSWTWTYLGTLAPGESVSIPLRYTVGSGLGSVLTAAFSQYRYNLFMSATVQDTVNQENNLSEKVGYFPGTFNSTPEF